MLLFSLFSRTSLFSAFNVLVSSHPVHSALYLVSTFIRVSGLLLLIEADLLAILFIIVYVGAIAILFLFVIIILDLKPRVLLKQQIIPVLPATSLTLFVFLSQLLVQKTILMQKRLNADNFIYQQWILYLDNTNVLTALGQILYTSYLVEFLLAGLILLVALIGAIILTLPTQLKSKSQLIAQQLSRRENRIQFQTRL